jgi:hypothetical protein
MQSPDPSGAVEHLTPALYAGLRCCVLRRQRPAASAGCALDARGSARGPGPTGVRAVQITRFGGPEVLDIVDLPDPTPGTASSSTRCPRLPWTSPTPTTPCPERYISATGPRPACTTEEVGRVRGPSDTESGAVPRSSRSFACGPPADRHRFRHATPRTTAPPPPHQLLAQRGHQLPLPAVGRSRCSRLPPRHSPDITGHRRERRGPRRRRSAGEPPPRPPPTSCGRTPTVRVALPLTHLRARSASSRGQEREVSPYGMQPGSSSS